MFDFIFGAIGALFDAIGEIVATVIDGIISFFDHVVGYFKGLKLRRGRDVPFIANEAKMADLIHHAPEKNVGIFQATYNEDTGIIENYRSIEADEMDDKTREILGEEKLVVLK